MPEQLIFIDSGKQHPGKETFQLMMLPESTSLARQREMHFFLPMSLFALTYDLARRAMP